MNGVVSLDAYEAKVNGVAVKFDVDEEGLYFFEYEVVAAELGEVLKIQIKEGLNASGIEFTMSPLYYAKVIASSDKASDADKNLAKAIKLYADAAVAYKASITNAE